MGGWVVCLPTLAVSMLSPVTMRTMMPLLFLTGAEKG